MVTSTRRRTIDDLHAMPDGGLSELIDGEIVVSAAPGEPHLWVVKQTVVQLLPHELQWQQGWLYIAPSEVRLPSGDVVEPDLFFVLAERAAIRRGSHIEGAPDLAFEVTSPSSRRRDLVDKRRLYEVAGVRDYWILDPFERQVTALALEEGQYRELEQIGTVIRSRVLPGFELHVDALFADLPNESPPPSARYETRSTRQARTMSANSVMIGGKAPAAVGSARVPGVNLIGLNGGQGLPGGDIGIGQRSVLTCSDICQDQVGGITIDLLPTDRLQKVVLVMVDDIETEVLEVVEIGHPAWRANIDGVGRAVD